MLRTDFGCSGRDAEIVLVEEPDGLFRSENPILRRVYRYEDTVAITEYAVAEPQT